MLILNDGRSELWQWDTARTLSVDVECSQVHFSNKLFGRSIDVDVVDGVVYIPDVLLQTDKEFTAWAFVGSPESGYTKISKVFRVNRRNKPADYVFTPTEQTTLEEVMKRLDRVPGEINKALAEAKASGEFDGEPGKPGETPYIKDGYWWTGETNTNVKAKGEDGITPHIGENGNWYISDTDTGVKAQGELGQPGDTPYIKDGYWWIGQMNTGVKAQGDDYVLTEADKEEIVNLVIEALPNGDEVAY